MNNIKLNKPISRLMREGSSILPKHKEEYFSYVDDTNIITGACAIGAAAIAALGSTKSCTELSSTAHHLTCFFGKKQTIHPVKKVKENMAAIILDLNDFQNWTREQIADWLEKEGY